MMENKFYNKLSINPIIAAVKDINNLELAIRSPIEVIFLLKGNICNMKEIVDQVKASEKDIYIHIDLMEGIGKDSFALQYIKNEVKPDGIITTKSNFIKIAKEMNIFCIQRLFIIDHLSLESGVQSVHAMKPDGIEIMPGIMPRITKNIKDKVNIPIITGGLISYKEDVIQSLQAGALGVSTSKKEIWEME